MSALTDPSPADSTPVIFVGGPESGHKYRVNNSCNSVFITTHRDQEPFAYQRATLTGERATFDLFVPDDWNGDQVIAFLLDNLREAGKR